jgi:sulfate adenylyltransferase
MATPKTCGHDESAWAVLSVIEVRAILRDGGALPPEFTRPEVAALLDEAFQDRAVRN